MIRVREDVNILDMLRSAGYSSYRIAQERIFGQSTLTKFRKHFLPSWGELNTICNLCSCSPWDVVEYVPDTTEDETKEIP